jgi:transketolase
MKVTNKNLSGAIRSLSIDAIEKANSGHPGMPLGFADVATVLFKDFLKFSSNAPTWADRDRFVLSAGHGSMLIYSLLYLTGHKDISLEDIKKFRQLGSKTAGHPEVEMLEAVETTTGPLGQGIANAVGMALAEKINAVKFPTLVDHHTYTVVGDGCLMEGIASEAISFAGHYKLNKLIVLFDDNNICIDGDVSTATSENHALKFKANGWNVFKVDGHNYKQVAKAILKAKKSKKPTFIACKTVIGFGSPKAASAASHGSPLNKQEIALTKEKLGCNWGEFTVPEDVLEAWKEIGKQNDANVIAWDKKLKALSPAKRKEFLRLESGKLPENWSKKFQEYKKSLIKDKKPAATRKSSGAALEVLTKEIPELIGGSADLTGSVNTKTSVTSSITPTDFSGRYIHYGIREHAMAAIMNGMALHKGVIPYSGTFLVFSDYCRPAIRLSSLMQQRVIYVFTHDSIGLGEDGPTHQPIEHLDSLRLIPNLNVFRPCDAYETAECWELALKCDHTPSVISLTRQSVQFLTEKYSTLNKSAKGAYIIAPETGSHKITIIATGSEVEIAVAVKNKLENKTFGIRVVSVPETTIFSNQSEKYKKEVLGNKKVVGIEASTGSALKEFADYVVSIKGFGASGPAKDLYQHFGISESNLEKKIKELSK